MTNTAAAYFPIITGHLSSHEGGTLTLLQVIVLVAFAVVMLTAMWVFLTTSGNAAMDKVVKRFRKARR